jgi:cytosine/adenosine deaminase-related metal-dependent hydrolase
VRTAGVARETAVESVIFAAGAMDVHSVVVDGRVVVADGMHTTLDVAGELRRTIAVAQGDE